ncbi:MAG TPA: hypothetical protein PLQ39_11265 [Acinetobacter sp.]|nr:hypothetical protein [Acinetobacter sp.]
MYDAFIEIIKQYALQAISGFRGFKLWVAKLVVKLIINTLKELGVAVNERIKAEQRLKEYEAIINKPNVTPDERRDADRDFLK